jgi:hypothetical protein
LVPLHIFRSIVSSVRHATKIGVLTIPNCWHQMGPKSKYNCRDVGSTLLSSPIRDSHTSTDLSSFKSLILSVLRCDGHCRSSEDDQEQHVKTLRDKSLIP